MKSAIAWRRQPFVGVALSAMLGVAIGDFVGAGHLVVPLAAAGLTALAALVLRRSFAVYLFVAATFFCLHAIRLTAAHHVDLGRVVGDAPVAVTVTGLVESEPKLSKRGVASFTVGLRSVAIDGTEHKTPARVLARWKGAVRYGDELRLFGTAGPVPPPRNPGEFDMKSFLSRQNITRQVIVSYPENGSIVRHTAGNVILTAAQRSRATLQRVLSRGLEDSPEVQAAITGMALGIRHQSGDDIEQPFQQTGTLHLFAVAGLHVGIVAQLLWILARLARLPGKWATVLITLSLLFYSAVTGLHTSSVRAAIMAAVLLSGFFVERKVFALNSLAAAATLILWYNTNELFAIGFQLSFAVVTAIILIAEPTSAWLQRLLTPDAFLPRSLFTRVQRASQNGWRWIARGLSVSFGAWVGSLVPMIAYYNLITPVSLFANLLVVPIAFLVLAGSLMSILCASFSMSLSVIFNNANWLLTRIILALVHLFAQLPAGHWYVEHPHRPTGAALDITVLDVGTGGAIHLRTARNNWLIDAAARRDFDRTLRPYLRSRGTNRLAALMLTHADASHIGGARGLIDLFAPAKIIDSAAPARSSLNRDLAADIAAKRLRHEVAATGTEYSLSREVRARVLFPPPDFQADSADDQALVLQLCVHGQQAALLMSDSGQATERALLASGRDLRSSIIIKGQNRGGVSGSADFLDAVKPRVIIATSRDFPENERLTNDWISMVRARGIKLFRQDETGAARVFIFADGRFVIRSYLNSEIFRNDAR